MKIKLLSTLVVLGIITLTSCSKDDNIRPEDEPLGVLGGPDSKFRIIEVTGEASNAETYLKVVYKSSNKRVELGGKPYCNIKDTVLKSAPDIELEIIRTGYPARVYWNVVDEYVEYMRRNIPEDLLHEIHNGNFDDDYFFQKIRLIEVKL
ncbi:hypothetical protein H8B06_19270 [Sphingobacterium sp. DN00404]|uniref:Lipoprotein n=1 Tax=Sphingobacterium micropteri TaxID=2763501 RepID=A0ABR7YUE1_9SPHI|nr:hypothetical protein [Sphingobacterium micropteri]MBD1434969.1 hypothetical protein [Sphingobacterium micropteri]